MIYLDYQATTPIAPEVRSAMLPWYTDKHANPHAAHKAGREAAAHIEIARESIAALLPPGGEVYFTSGATEALNWAIAGVPRGMIAFADSEHSAVRETAHWVSKGGPKPHLLPLKLDGLIDTRTALPKGIKLLAAMMVNNEIGVIQPISKLAKMAHDAGALMLCDAVQSFGRMPIPKGPDMIAISAHKIHGPKGIGALWVKKSIKLQPLIHGGGQEGGLRSGTLSPALCVGFGTAAALARQRMDADAAHVEMLWTTAKGLIPQGWELNGSATKRYRGNLNIRRDGLDSARLISELREVAISTGSTCASHSANPSHVLASLGLSKTQAKSSLRIGFGRYTTLAELREGLRMIFAAAGEQF